MKALYFESHGVILRESHLQIDREENEMMIQCAITPRFGNSYAPVMRSLPTGSGISIVGSEEPTLWESLKDSTNSQRFSYIEQEYSRYVALKEQEKAEPTEANYVFTEEGVIICEREKPQEYVAALETRMNKPFVDSYLGPAALAAIELEGSGFSGVFPHLYASGLLSATLIEI